MTPLAEWEFSRSHPIHALHHAGDETLDGKFADMTDLRDALKEPDRFQLFKLLHDIVPAKELHAFEGGEGGAAASFPDQRVSLAKMRRWAVIHFCAPLHIYHT